MNALKAISKTDTELRVGNYMVLFGGRDLEGEYFTKATEFGSAYTDIDMIAIDWEHGFAPDGEPGRHDILGKVDWSTAKADERGLFVERVLNRRNQYVALLEQLIDDGLVGNSSEAVPSGVEKGEDGEIKVWPLMRDTLTVSPMEPRMLSENSLAAMKALSQRIPALKSYISADSDGDAKTDEPEADSASAATVADEAAKAKRLLLELDLLEISI